MSAAFMMYSVLLLEQCSTGGVNEPCAVVVVDVDLSLTQEEQLQNILALHRIQQVALVKMGYSLELNLKEPPKPPPPVQGAVLHVVNSDDPTVHVRLAKQSGGTTPPGAPRLLVSIGPGMSIGRGQWSWRGTACNATDAEQAVDQGDVETAFNSAGIPVTGFGEAQTSNQLYINRSKPVVATRILQGAAIGGTALIASKLVTASGVWGGGFAVGTVVMSLVVDYFKSVTPADLGVRFQGSKILKDGETMTLAPRGQPNHCSTWVLFARYSGKKAVARSGIPVF